MSKRRLEGGRESKKRRECSVEETSDDQRKSSRKVSGSPRKSSINGKHSRKDYREKSSKKKDSKRSDGERSRHKSKGREDGSDRKDEKGREGERKDKREDRDQGRRKESDRFGEMLSKSGGKSELKKREYLKSSKHQVLRVGEDTKGREAKDAEKEKVVSSPLKGPGSKSFASRGGVKEHDNMDGPACPKCGQVCKNKEGLRNHMLSHYYEVFFEVGRVHNIGYVLS